MNRMNGATNQGGYRADIDGLRALAILPVLFFHAHVPGFSGGYVGVDIFFVISGFLITRIIAAEIDGGDFSLVRFYERRFRRIIPALTVMIVAVLAAAAWLYLPGDIEGVPRSALAATLFASNIWFYTDTGYFSGGADVKPLLHTWSLAVEEQFYIGFPLLLMMLASFGNRRKTLIIASVAALSLTLSILLYRDGSGFAFYLLPTRAWELLAGGLLALGAVPVAQRQWVREAIAWAGLLAICGAILFYDRTTAFPGYAAILPVAGATALLNAAPGTSAAALLQFRPFLWIGLLSYSLYLWHWPLIVFTEYATDKALYGLPRIAVITGAFGAAFLSWRFVERPFRNRAKLSGRAIFIMTGGAMTLLLLLSIAMIAMGGWNGRFSPAALRLMTAKHDVSPLRKQCHDSFVRGIRPCVIGNAAQADTMLWGDSHGVEMAYALSLAQPSHGIIERTTSSCPPVLNLERKDPRCARANQANFDALRNNPAIRRVYLVAFWANGTSDDAAFVAKLDQTIAAIDRLGRQVILIGPVPPHPFDVPRRLAHMSRPPQHGDILGVSPTVVKARTVRLRAMFDRWHARGITVIDPVSRLCDRRGCAVARDGKPLYFDSHHLSVTGARIVIGDGV